MCYLTQYDHPSCGLRSSKARCKDTHFVLSKSHHIRLCEIGRGKRVPISRSKVMAIQDLG